MTVGVESVAAEASQPPPRFEMAGERYEWWRCLQVAEQLYLTRRIIELNAGHYGASGPAILEAGPGDYTLASAIKPLSVAYDTINLDPGDTLARFHGDLRDESLRSEIGKDRYDIFVACEVFEHMSFRDLPATLDAVRSFLRPGGMVLVSLPVNNLYINLRVERGYKQAWQVWLPIAWGTLSRILFIPRFFYRRFVRGLGWRHAVSMQPEELPHNFHGHHWELGNLGTERGVVRRLFKSRFDLLLEHFSPSCGTVYYVMRRRD